MHYKIKDFNISYRNEYLTSRVISSIDPAVVSTTAAQAFFFRRAILNHNLKQGFTS